MWERKREHSLYPHEQPEFKDHNIYFIPRKGSADSCRQKKGEREEGGDPYRGNQINPLLRGKEGLFYV